VAANATHARIVDKHTLRRWVHSAGTKKDGSGVVKGTSLRSAISHLKTALHLDWIEQDITIDAAALRSITLTAKGLYSAARRGAAVDGSVPRRRDGPSRANATHVR